MTPILEDVHDEIVELHNFFTSWFNGTADESHLDHRFLSRLHQDFIFIPPSGKILTAADMAAGFSQGFGSNKDLKIKIRDVSIRYQVNDYILATYSEWQYGTQRSETSENARLSTVLMQKGTPFKWLHLHETWLDMKAAQ